MWVDKMRFLILLFIVIIIVYFSKKYILKVNECIKKIDVFYYDLSKLRSNYITQLDKRELINKYRFIKKDYNLLLNEKFKQFINDYENLDLIIENYNEEFIQQEMIRCRDFFNNLFKYPIDEDQRRAIITDDNNNLIIAGAGSGKTTTIIGKTKYLIEQKNVNPEEIITISFTKAAAENFKEKLDDKRVYCSTFHKLGKDILESDKKLDIADENYLNNIITKYLNEEISKNEEEAVNLIKFYSYYMYLIDENNDRKFSEMIEDAQCIDLETLKGKINKDKNLNTIKNEIVKSEQELVIANFLFLNGIKYEYEPKYKYDTATKNFKQYHPDFYLPEYDIYLEHFGINKYGRAPQYNQIEEEKYLDGIKKKREIHNKYQTKLIETYSYDFDNYDIENVLAKKLRQNGIKFRKVDYKEIIDFLKKSKNNDTLSLYKLISKFIKLFKGNNYTLDKFDDFYMDALKKKNYRNTSLIKIIKNIYLYYETNLIKDKCIDFDDMINLATQKVMKKYDKKLSYIIIDEFQDISYSRYLLVKELQNKTCAKIIAVGDDWQSIFRFSGCDLDLFINFNKYFENPKLMYIRNTYRNCQNLINISSSFIMKNEKGQLRKSIISNTENYNDPITFYYYNKNSVEATKKAIKDLRNIGCKNIAILGRNNTDVKIYGIEPELTKKETNLKKIFGDGVVFTTIHKSKGLEYDGVIICNLRNYINGFPNKMSDDPILSYVTLTKDDYLYEEERRLFYVALTRTKTQCSLLVPIMNPSIFIEELIEISNNKIQKTIIEDDERLHNPKCPKCEKGVLLIKTNTQNNNEFVGCSNYPLCDFKYKDDEIIKKQMKCPRCNSYMVERKGPYGKFYGCINYPFCKQTVENEKNIKY